MVARNIDKCMSVYNMQQNAERHGKTYSWRYLIKKDYNDFDNII